MAKPHPIIVFLPKWGTTRKDTKVARRTTRFRRIGMILVISPAKMAVASYFA
jgi:hypothetical protein